MKNFGPNVVSFTITSGKRQWYVVRAYVPPNNQLAVHRVMQALARGQAWVEKTLVGYLNACLAQPRDQREEALATKVAHHSLTD